MRWVSLAILIVMQALSDPLQTALAADMPQVAAHRGTTTGAPENTLAAIRWALASGADLIETDLRMTADGALVLMHDASVNRTTNGQGRVDSLTLAELKRLDAGSGEGIPTLEEALALLEGRAQGLLLDVKDGHVQMAPRLAGAVAGHGYQNRVLVGVRTVELLLALKRLEPAVKTLALVPDPPAIDEFLPHRPDGVRLWFRWTTGNPDLIERVRSGGAEVWIMSGDREPQHLQALMMRVDGFITDRPVALSRYLYGADDAARR